MEIKSWQNPITKEVSYKINIKWDDMLDEFEIAECFKKQYPKTKCIISWSRRVKFNIGLLFIGLDFKHGKKTTNSNN